MKERIKRCRRRIKSFLSRTKSFFSGASVFVLALWVFAVIWVFRTWQNLKIEELLYELSAPLKGTGSEMIASGVCNILIPALFCLSAYVVVGLFVRRFSPQRKREYVRGCLLAGSAAALIAFGVAWYRLDVTTYVVKAFEYSTFIEDHYVDPKNVEIKFPKEKRNLIYIFLESVETTFMDIASGGAFEESPMKELTSLAFEGENFNGPDPSRGNNGARSPHCTTWTVAAMFAHSSGLPLKIRIGDNDMIKQKSFFSDIRCLGDILKDEGYRQTLFISSDAIFGGRKLYYKEHGDYNIKDYHHAVWYGKIPEGYYVHWGYEDYLLFDYVKEEILELASQEGPFNLTMLTTDTHFPHGYICPYCPKEPKDNKYSRAFACSSKMVTDFVRWIQQQDFYENTTIILVGDHLTMSEKYCKDIDEEYRRKVYLSILNADAECKKDEWREYSTFDMFPTTLAALGAEIEGDKLGLGVNLYADVPTLEEIYGPEYIDQQLEINSRFMEKHANIR